MENYFEQAVSCVKGYVLPMQQQIYENATEILTESMARQ